MKNQRDKSLSEIKGQVIALRSNPEWDVIKSISHDGIVNATPAALQNVLNPWLPTQGIAFVYAATGVGKTLFTLNVAYAIASGGDFLKFSAPKPRRVLYLDGEMAFNQIHKRYTEIVKQQGDLDDSSYFNLLNADQAAFRLPKICQPEGQDFYNRLIQENSIEVLFIDNLSMLSAIDENKANEWKQIQDWLIYLRSTGTTVVIVHHAGKDKNGYRGTSRMMDCVDTAISLQDTSQDQLENEITNTKKFKIEYQKNRTFGGHDAMAFDATLSVAGWEYNSVEQSNMDKIVERVKIGMRQSEIALDLSKSRPYISKMIKRAKAFGLINSD